ncbi:MAG: pitrilysin family protein [Cyanobacteria bacterium P01_A01_bin.84]
MFVLSAIVSRYRFPFLLFVISLISIIVFSDSITYAQVGSGLNLLDTNHLERVLGSPKNNNIKSSSVVDSVKKVILDNGLTVLLKKVDIAPVVTVQMWYKVGSRNEEPGVNGITHQLEHMMFNGTKDRPVQFGRLFSALGSDSNAFTSFDQTVYYSTAQSNRLEALLTLEADRMQNVKINHKDLEKEKRVVISELQGYENSPEYRLNRAVMKAAFPEHPYGLPIGGTKEDVKKFSVDKLQNYYKNLYSPDNAVLVIVGDLDTAKTLNDVRKIFGNIPRLVSKPKVLETQEKQYSLLTINPLSSDTHNSSTNSLSPKNPIILREIGSAGLLQFVYPLPDAKHPDVPALDVMDYILTEGRNSRLYKSLIESGVATDINGSASNLIEKGWYELSVTASSKVDLRKIDRMIERTIATIAKKGVTQEEIDRAKAQLEAAVILDNRDITSQGMQLGNDQLITGNYNYTEDYLTAVRQITTQDIQSVVRKYLRPELKTAGFFEPINSPKQAEANQEKLKKDFSTLPSEKFSQKGKVDIKDIAKYLPPLDAAIVSVAKDLPEEWQLPNGLQVLMLRDRSTPTVTLSGYIRAGMEFDPEDKAGLASLVAENLISGTKTKSASKLAKILDDRGADLDFQAYRQGVRIQGNSLADDLPVLMKVLGDVVQNSTFPRKEIQLSRQQALTALKQELNDPSEVAKRVFSRAIYPKKHPLQVFPTPESLKKIKPRDVREFKQKYYRPDAVVLVILGDFDVEKIRTLIAEEFGNWEVKGKAPIPEYPAAAKLNGIVRFNPIVPGKAQSITYMGNTTINRHDPQYYAGVILNQILGGDTLSSRLGSEIRDRQGLTYGIYSNFLARKNFGTFLIEIQTSPEDASQAIDSSRKLLSEIHKKGVSEEEVKATKQTLISNYNVALANPDYLAYKILKHNVYGLDRSELQTYTEKINAVSLSQVNKAARELLNPDKIVVVTAGPSKTTDGENHNIQ